MKPTLHIAYTKHGKVTGRELAKILDATSFGTKRPNYVPQILIRWGSRRAPLPYTLLELNPAESIRRASSKIECLTRLNAIGLNTIPWSKDWRDLADRGYRTILGRSEFGSRGRDIVVYHIDDGDIPKVHEWYSAYTHSTREYRLHVVGDKVIRVQGKYYDGNDPYGREGYIRNYAHGWRFRAPRRAVHSSRKREAIDAVKCLGLTFGAVDLIITEGGRARILEINSAPACSPLTLRCYAGALGQYVAQETGGQWEIAEELLAIEDPDMPADEEDI